MSSQTIQYRHLISERPIPLSLSEKRDQPDTYIYLIIRKKKRIKITMTTPNGKSSSRTTWYYQEDTIPNGDPTSPEQPNFTETISHLPKYTNPSAQILAYQGGYLLMNIGTNWSKCQIRHTLRPNKWPNCPNIPDASGMNLSAQHTSLLQLENMKPNESQCDTPTQRYHGKKRTSRPPDPENYSPAEIQHILTTQRVFTVTYSQKNVIPSVLSNNALSPEPPTWWPIHNPPHPTTPLSYRFYRVWLAYIPRNQMYQYFGVICATG